MQRFLFPLAAALEWRRITAEVEEAKLAALNLEHQGLQARFAALENEMQTAERELALQPSVQAQDLVALDLFRVHIHRRKRDCQNGIQECARQVTEQARRVQAARRAFRLLESLRDQRHAEWRKEFDREQEQLAAELHLAKHARNRRSSLPGKTL
jgi:hypothetical protein